MTLEQDQADDGSEVRSDQRDSPLNQDGTYRWSPLRAEKDGPAFLGGLTDQVRTEGEPSSNTLDRRIRAAKLRQPTADLCDVKDPVERGLSTEWLDYLEKPTWIKNRHNLIIEGEPGRGKTWLACAIAKQAVRNGFRPRYESLAKLIERWFESDNPQSLTAFCNELATFDLLVLDDWGLIEPDRKAVEWLYRVLDEWHESKSIIVATAIKTEAWASWLGSSPLAATLCDRLVHTSQHIRLEGPSMRESATLSPNP